MLAPDSRTTPTDDTPHDPIDDIIADYLDAVERGCAPSRQQLLATYPQHASELTEFLDDQDRVDAVVAPLVGRSSHGSDTLPVPPAGHTFGHFELIEELGRGGMGVVYKARQQGVQRIVALKMLGAGTWASPGDRERFRLEAEAIAELDHPHIVPLYEVGEAEGRPYYSMKWIEGGSLADRIASLREQPRSTVRLMLTVARAVDHAHQRGILHRDLKPANILLANAGSEPFVADFGLAKKLTRETTAPTQSGTALGTPSYMAPEQARNARGVTTAADVYSLGAILYECLTGRPPFRAATSVETLLEVLEREPPPPSSVAPGVDADLDTICLKCLQKEPGRRYASAAVLADDLERYLHGEPIQARPIGRVGRFLRWCRRDPVTAGLIAAVCVSLLVGFVLVLANWQRAETEKELAQTAREEAEEQTKQAEQARGEAETRKKEAEKAQAAAELHFRKAEEKRREADAARLEAHDLVAEFCVRLSEERLRDYPALLPVRKYLLEAALSYYEKSRKRNENDPGLRRDTASTLHHIGKLTAILGSRADAIVSLEKAATAYRALLAETPDDPTLVRDLAWTLNHLASQQSSLGRTAEARKSLEEARTKLDDLENKKQGNNETRRALAGILTNLNVLDGNEGRHGNDPARSAEQLLDVQRQLLEADPKSPTQRASYARACYNAGLAFNGSGRGDRAFESWSEARKIQEKLVNESNEVSHRYDLSLTCRHLGNWYSGRKKLSESLACYEKCEELLGDLSRTNPEVLDYEFELACVYSDRGGALSRNDRRDDGMKEMLAALELRRKLAERRKGEPRFEIALGQSHHNLGNFYLHAGRHTDALESYRKGEECFRNLLRADRENAAYQNYLAGTLNNLADVLQKVNRSAEALRTFEEAVRLQKMALEKAPEVRAYRLSLGSLARNLGRAYRLDKRPANAVALALEMREVWRDNDVELARLLREFTLAAQLVPADSPQRKAYLDHAVDTLAQALALGYRDHDHLRSDPDLALLRQRQEFELLLKTNPPR